MPRTKGNKNRPKTNIIKDYASQIVEKQGGYCVSEYRDRIHPESD